MLPSCTNKIESPCLLYVGRAIAFLILDNKLTLVVSAPKTLFEKIWDAHVVKRTAGYPDALFIDRHFIHEVTSPQAFDGLRQRGIGLFNTQRTTATAD